MSREQGPILQTNYTAIVAVANDNVIGYDNTIPWPKLSADMKHFRKTTEAKAVLMGRKTYDSIGRPLPNRDNIVLTRDVNWRKDKTTFKVLDLEDALQLCKLSKYRDVYIIGGSEVFNLFSGLITKYIVTRVDWNLPLDSDPEKVVRFDWPLGLVRTEEYPLFEKANENEPNAWVETYEYRMWWCF